MAAPLPDDDGERTPVDDSDLTPIEGERATSAVRRPPSLQSRLSNLLAFGLMATSGSGYSVWYYANVVGADRARGRRRSSAQKAPEPR